MNLKAAFGRPSSLWMSRVDHCTDVAMAVLIDAHMAVPINASMVPPGRPDGSDDQYHHDGLMTRSHGSAGLHGHGDQDHHDAPRIDSIIAATDLASA